MIGLSYGIGLLGLAGAYVWRARAERCRTELKEITDVDTVYSVKDLHRLKHSENKRDKELLEGKRNCLVSGVLVRKNFSHAEQEAVQRRHLYKRLGLAIEQKQRLVRAEIQQAISTDGTHVEGLTFLRTPRMEKDCLLIDETGDRLKLKNTTLAVAKSANQLESVFNLRRKRKLREYLDVVEVVKYVALEGTSLSLLGLVKYDVESDTFAMTHLSSIMAGGMQEARRCLS